MCTCLPNRKRFFVRSTTILFLSFFTLPYRCLYLYSPLLYCCRRWHCHCTFSLFLYYYTTTKEKIIVCFVYMCVATIKRFSWKSLFIISPHSPLPPPLTWRTASLLSHFVLRFDKTAHSQLLLLSLYFDSFGHVHIAEYPHGFVWLFRYCLSSTLSVCVCLCACVELRQLSVVFVSVFVFFFFGLCRSLKPHFVCIVAKPRRCYYRKHFKWI